MEGRKVGRARCLRSRRCLRSSSAPPWAPVVGFGDYGGRIDPVTEMSKPSEAVTSTELRNSLCTQLERSEISNTSAPAQAQAARLPLDFIRVGGRHRRDMGDIGSLAA